MAQSVVIVESPAKCKTLKKYLGKDFEIFASYGHVRDLKPKEGAVDPDNDFKMTYEVIDRNKKHFDAIVKAVKKADFLYLATDPDREGEAISWHIHEMLEEKKLLKGKKVHRVSFNQITKKAVTEAMAHPRALSIDMINAQQARRALDYLVGFNLSPLLWKKIRAGLSAGRVQSPALRMIVEREEAIEAFVPKEYWSIEADVNKSKSDFVAKLTTYKGEKLNQFSVNNTDDATSAREALLDAAGTTLTVTKVEKKQRKRNPQPPFTTSTLQQEASRKLGFTTQRTMRTAQQLYEGVEIGGGDGPIGLISYMRTDSVNLAVEATDEIRELITKRYGAGEIPKTPNSYKTKAKNAQEAHEAIRPTSVNYIPSEIKTHLTSDQFKLYELIWKRTIACQMIHATLDMVGVNLQAGDVGIFRASGSTVRKPGFMAVYQESQDDSKGDKDERLLPPMEEGDSVELKAIRSEQHFTEPPPRFTEASLVKTLEEHGIGRPSTYASIISTLVSREYVELEKRRFTPTDVGRVVSRFLTKYFSQYVDYEFTAKLEDQLDAVSRGEQQWLPVMKQFWSPFKERIDDTNANVQRKDVTQEAIDEKCPKCETQLSIRLGRRGRFIGCTNYPECDYTRDMDGNSKDEPEIIEGRQCPECESNLIIRSGRYGKFIGCSNYPNCKHMEPLEKPADTDVECPKCKQGSILQRKSRRGKIFYSCSRYPDCDYALWNEPVKESCPECQWPILTIKVTKRSGKQKLCPQDDCSFIESVEETEETEEE
ncbi:MAG: DNA topoisomerase I [Gammaproteobacteria bacterium]|nr:type I DNA topoisomerase [Gammaproteobacteria bacterium]PCH62584.1 MAG: DNA topoisomerase I [Gammaproteobacteria bacterium]